MDLGYNIRMEYFVKIIITALAVIAAAYILPGISVSNFTVAVIVAIILGIMNAVVKPILFILTLPLTVLTLGLFYLILKGD